MSQRMVDIPVYDIKPLVAVPDYSFYFFIVLTMITIAIAVSTVLFLVKKFRRRGESERQQRYAQLSSIDLSDPKKAAYAMCEIGRYFARENERSEKGYRNLFERLEPYKYAPNVDDIDDETIGYYRLYLSIIDA
ncbi:MAG: hypothetical protein M0P91_08110 [Sulfuricurvum sp.]|jgi:hypothetical protein|uniref:hypothetical protein n=1 Tax=Sulfuricurvum sp. TaxID=2025608 RepID=UPI0025FA2707|nr:hypothetical protein [Sulfuricurvum sp.]MCK9373149.1 hypothetical protein [Sulfuricurvum sp.]